MHMRDCTYIDVHTYTRTCIQGCMHTQARQDIMRVLVRSFQHLGLKFSYLTQIRPVFGVH